MRRRDFLRGALGVGLVGVPAGLRPPGSRSRPGPGADMAGSAAGLPASIGVQLYTVRSLMADDPEGTLAALAGIGYGEVERAGLAGLTVPDFRGLLERTGLRAVSSHEALSTVLEGPGIERATALGQSWIVVPSLDRERHTADGYRRTADDFNRAGQAARAAGLRFAFHNHAQEFDPLADGSTGFGTLMERCDPELVSFQLDVFWAVEGGQDPLALFRAHPGRFTSLHVKDRTADGTMVDVGRGVIDYGAVLAAGDRAGVEHLFIEHDRPDDPLDSVRVSYGGVRSLLDAATRRGGAAAPAPRPIPSTR